MSKWYHAACPKCNSSDAFSYTDKDIEEGKPGFCFSCNESSRINGSSQIVKEENVKIDFENASTLPFKGFRERLITRHVTEAFGVRSSVDESGDVDAHYYPYLSPTGEVAAYKVRSLPKSFQVIGDADKSVGYFTYAHHVEGPNLVITEGELDAMSVAQAQAGPENKGRFYPVWSLSSASAWKALLKHQDKLRSFKSVVLWLDNDEPGQKATKELAKVIGFDKVKVVHHSEKDASDVLVKHGHMAVTKAIFDAKPYSPAGIVRGEDVWTALMERQGVESIEYPKCLGGINEKTMGMRQGEITLFTSGTGSGKSTVIKEIILDLLAKTEDQIGLVSLEESVGDTAQKFIGMALGKNLMEYQASEEELREGYNQVFGDERLVLLDHQGSVSDESLVDKLDYLALMGCKYIVLDHITIAVSEGAKGKTGNEAVDSVMSDLLKLVKRHNIWLGVISHLRKGDKPFEEGHLPTIDDIKGSGSIKQISFDIVGFARNLVAESEVERNTIKFRVLKSRFTGRTGDAGTATYNPDTGRLVGNDVRDFASLL